QDNSCARDRRRRCPVTLGAEHPIRKSVRNDKRCILAETVALSYYLPMSSGWVMNSHSSSPLFFHCPQPKSYTANHLRWKHTIFLQTRNCMHLY
ncbi:unnamed protein product, partial [Brassica oleracea]